MGWRHLHQEGSPKQTQETSSPIIQFPAVLTPVLLVEACARVEPEDLL